MKFMLYIKNCHLPPSPSLSLWEIILHNMIISFKVFHQNIPFPFEAVAQRNEGVNTLLKALHLSFSVPWWQTGFLFLFFKQLVVSQNTTILCIVQLIRKKYESRLKKYSNINQTTASIQHNLPLAVMQSKIQNEMKWN